MPAAFGPGRANLIGEHTDYNDGLALPFAVSDGVTVWARARTDGQIVATALDVGGERDTFSAADPPRGEGWRAFVRGAVGELGRAGVELGGAELEIQGTVHQGSGLSSSAALEVALVLALRALAGEPGPAEADRTELARLCSRVENDWVGAETGLLDQLASLYGQAERALRIDFRAVTVDPVPLELGEHRLVVLDSGQTHSLAASGYNDRRRECALACERLGIDSLRDATLEAAAELPEPLDRRVRHVVSENARVMDTVAALSVGDLSAVGELLDASHASLRDDYAVSTPAVEKAIGTLHDAGAIGARIMGGGFGGSVLGLFAPGAEPPSEAAVVNPGPGARLLDDG